MPLRPWVRWGRLVQRQHAVFLDGFSREDDAAFRAHAQGVVDPGVDERVVEDLERASVHFVGRVAHEGMSRHAPSLSGPVADVMNRAPKVVCARTLTRADGPETRIARGDVVDEVVVPKGEVEGEILAHGGFRLAEPLVRHDLVDVLNLNVVSVTLGRGTSLLATRSRPRVYRRVSSAAILSVVIRQQLPRGAVGAP